MSATDLPFADLRPGADAVAVRAAIDRVMTRGWFVLGPELEAFEQEFASAAGARHAVGVANGTDAITLLLRASGVAPGDEVLVPAMTAAFTGLAVLAMGAQPVLVDVDADTLTIDLAACESALSDRVRAIVPVHLYGQPADMPALQRFAERHGLLVIEDCCQAHLATCRHQPVGTFGTGGAFSFYPTKNLAALGDAGAVLTNDEAVAARVRRLRHGGQSRTYHHEEAGVNSRLDEIQAAVLRVRLQNLAAATERRRELARRYRAGLRGVATLPERDAGHVYHLFPVRSPRRDALQTYLGSCGIGTLIHYPRPLTAQPAFAACRQLPSPRADQAAAELLSLPLRPEMTDADADRVITAVNTFVS